jgi:hypothetical protein
MSPGMGCSVAALVAPLVPSAPHVYYPCQLCYQPVIFQHLVKHATREKGKGREGERERGYIINMIIYQ